MNLDDFEDDQEAKQAGETPLHWAVRYRRLEEATFLLDHGADIDAKNGYGKTAYAHAIRRGFHEIVAMLAKRGADTKLSKVDLFAEAVINGEIDAARSILDEHPDAARTGNPGEDRLLADVTIWGNTDAVALLIKAGANLTAPGLDLGTPLHQAGWFGQPECARLLIDAGAPVNVFGSLHGTSPLGWAVHGSQYSGDETQMNDDVQERYVNVVQILIGAGASFHHPNSPNSDDYIEQLLRDASPRVKQLLQRVIPAIDKQVLMFGAQKEGPASWDTGPS